MARRTLGEELKVWRVGRGLSQREASAIADTTQTTWSRWERDEQIPDALELKRILSAARGALTAKVLIEAAGLRQAG